MSGPKAHRKIVYDPLLKNFANLCLNQYFVIYNIIKMNRSTAINYRSENIMLKLHVHIYLKPSVIISLHFECSAL